MNTNSRISFLGAGLMGAPMVGNLLRAGYAVNIWNRSGHRPATLAKIGAVVCRTQGEAVSGAGIVILMLGDGAAVDEVLFQSGMVETLTAGAVVIDFSSVAPKAARQNADRLKARDISYPDAPVSGGTAGASDGTLAIFVGGSARALSMFRTLIADGMSEYDHSSLLLALEGLNPQYRLSDAPGVAPAKEQKVSWNAQ